MARATRFQYPGAIYHVMARGDGGKVVFETDDDRKAFVFRLAQVCESHGWRIHAWVLMGNHFHLLLETLQANLVSGMKYLMGTFSQGWNRARLRRGHVFQGRYKAVPVNGTTAGQTSVGDTITSGILAGQKVEQDFDSWLSPRTHTASFGPQPLGETTYQYGPSGAVRSVGGNGNTDSYFYHPQKRALETVTYTPDRTDGPILQSTRKYDAANRLTRITAHVNDAGVQKPIDHHDCGDFLS